MRRPPSYTGRLVAVAALCVGGFIVLPTALGVMSMPGLGDVAWRELGLAMGLQPLWKTYVFPSDDDYAAVVFRLGDFKPEEIEAVIQEFDARSPAESSLKTLDLIEQMAASIRFK